MIPLYVILGLVLGLGYFTLLKAGLRFTGRPMMVGLMAVLRLAAATGGFWVAAQAGAVSLLAALGGFLAGRWLMVRGAG